MVCWDFESLAYSVVLHLSGVRLTRFDCINVAVTSRFIGYNLTLSTTLAQTTGLHGRGRELLSTWAQAGLHVATMWNSRGRL